MKDEKIREQAKIIFQAGRMIHDRILRFHSSCLTDGTDEEGNDLSVSQMRLVYATAQKEWVTITELSEVLGVSPPSASAMVDRLVEKGILTREHSHEDRRKVQVRVSQEALKNIRKFEDRLLQSFAYLIEKIGPDLAEKWCEVLKQVRKVIQEDKNFPSLHEMKR